MSEFDNCGKPKNDYVAGKVSFRDLPPDYPYNLTRNARRLDNLLAELKVIEKTIKSTREKYEKSK